MKPAPFEYIAPTDLTDALDALHQHGFDAKLLAGGQSLVPVMNFRLAQPSVLIDLNELSALNFIRQESNGTIHFGSMVRQNQLERDPLVKEHLPLLHETIPFIAHPQIRNRGTFGGSIAHADPAGELPVIAVALNGRFRIQSKTADRWVNAVDFFQALFETDCGDEEMITEIELPPMAAKTGTAFTEVARRHGDYALGGVAAVVTVDTNQVCTNARLIYLNAGEIPMVAEKAAQMLVGEKMSEELLMETAVTASTQEINPTTDIHANDEYKRHLAKVLTIRALKTAFERADNWVIG